MSLEEFKQLNTDMGKNWFSPDTVRFFKSRIEHWYGDGYFITSEQGPDGVRRYSVRTACFKTGSVNTAEQSKFQQFKTLAAARKWVEA
jgi:hypothetical protein